MEAHGTNQDPLKSAEELFEKHRYSEAVRAFQDLLSRGDTRAAAYLGLGNSLNCLWRYDEAIVNFEKALTTDAEPLLAHSGLAEALYGLRRYRKAITHYEKVKNIHVARVDAAQAKERDANDQTALFAAERDRIDATESLGDSYNDLGFTYLCLREYELAIANLRDAKKNGIEYPYAYHNLASVFWTQGKYDEAMKEWRTARKLYFNSAAKAKDKEWTGHFLYFGNLLHEVFGDLEQAEKAYKEGLEIDQNQIKPWIGLVALYLEKMENSAKERSEAYWKARDAHAKAKSLIAEVLRSAADVETLVLSAELSLTMKDYDNADKLLREALKKDEEATDPYIKSAKPKADLGILCMRRKKFDEAIGYFEAALKRESDDLSLRSNLAEAYLRNSQLEDAEREFQIVLERAPNHVESRIGLGGVYTALGDTGDSDMYDAAIAQYDEAIRLAGRLTGSKRLRQRELAGVLYSRGYARVKLYEVSKAPKDLGRLFDARDDFKMCFRNDADQHKAKRAVEKINKVVPARSPQRLIEVWGPSVILMFSIVVFLLSQAVFIWSFVDKSKFPRLSFLSQSQLLTIEEYIALTFGSLVLMVASSYLPQLLKLKVPGMELEKAAVDQITTLGPIGISKAS